MFEEHVASLVELDAATLRNVIDNLDVWSCHVGILVDIVNFSKFFGPSPRKHRLTVYRGLQVVLHRWVAAGSSGKSM